MVTSYLVDVGVVVVVAVAVLVDVTVAVMVVVVYKAPKRSGSQTQRCSLWQRTVVDVETVDVVVDVEVAVIAVTVVMVAQMVWASVTVTRIPQKRRIKGPHGAAAMSKSGLNLRRMSPLH